MVMPPNQKRTFIMERILMAKSGRGTGRTTRQMLDAPNGAIYIWCNGDIAKNGYPDALKKFLKRDDLVLYSIQFLENRGWRGLSTTIVVDHACDLSIDAQQSLQEYLDYLSSRTSKSNT